MRSHLNGSSPSERWPLRGPLFGSGGDTGLGARTPPRPSVRTAGIVLLLAIAVVIPGAMVTAARPPATRTRPDLQRVLVELTSGPGRIGPGATAFVAGPGGMWFGAAGTADATGQPMPPDARMRLESVSKIWTGVLVIGLAEQGRLGLDDTVARWLPGLLPFGDRITLRQLLTHTSGIFDNNDAVNHPAQVLGRIKDPAVRAEFLRWAERIQANPAIRFPPTVWIRLAATQPLYFTPGSGYHYSNIGFEVLGLVIERAAGRPLATVYRDRIFEPLGLRQTAYDPQGGITGAHARGYTLDADGNLVDQTAVHLGVGAEGGIVSTAAETAQFLSALMQGRLLGPVALARMKTSDFWSGGRLVGSGFAYGHSGGGGGYKTDVLVSGDGSRVAVLLLNGRGADPARSDARSDQAVEELYRSS
jgi:D-alanyl-D-alanine carboxypeptidase